MTPGRLARLAPTAAAAGALLLCACVHEREKKLALIPEGSLARAAGEVPGAHASRSGNPFGGQAWPGAAPTVDVASRVPPPLSEGPAPAGPSSLPPAFAAPAPPRNPARPAAHRPIPSSVNLADVAREKFLTAPTEVDARRATFYCPPAYAAEATLAGSALVEEAPGRRTAAGHAVLRLRHLVVRAERITLVVRSDGKPDVQLSARGEVSLRSEQAASRIEEIGLKSLLLTNDGYTPLR